MSLQAGARFPDSLLTLTAFSVGGGEIFKKYVSNFLPPLPETKKKQKAYSPFLLVHRDESFLGSCPFLFFACLEKEFSFGHRGKSRERFCLIRLVSIITNKSQAELPTRRTGVGLPAWRGLGWPLPSALGIAGDVQGLLRFLGPPRGREHPGLTRAQSFLPNFVESCRGATTPLPLLCACSAATTPANGRLRRPRPRSSEPLAPHGPRSPPAGGASARRSSAQPASCVCPSGFPFRHKDRGGPLPQADLRHLPPCRYLLLF